MLTDILGDEDHLGDMDFKVAGTSRGRHRRADGHQDRRASPREVMRDALYQARTAASTCSARWSKALAAPRGEIAQHAPRIETIHIHPDKIRDVIGPGGKVIRGIVEQTGCKIDVSDDGTVLVASADGVDDARGAIDIIQGITRSPGSRPHLQRQRAAHRRLRRLRRDLPGNRRAAAHLADRREARRRRCATS